VQRCWRRDQLDPRRGRGDTATLVFPTVYRKAMGASESHFMKLCVTFAAGHGYQSLMDAA